MTRPAQAILDLPALRHNLTRVRQLAPGRHSMPVIKANAYGHGMVKTARALQDSDAFAVACLDEALILREAGIAQPLVLLEGFFEAAELPLLSRHRLTAVVHHEEQVAMLERTRFDAPLPVWLKVDTGMHRLGLAPDKVAEAWRRLNACASLQVVGFMTHLANADYRDDPLTLQQVKRFNQAVEPFPGQRSIANSAAILTWPQTHGDWVRPGIMLYGVSPFADSVGEIHGLKPALSLCSRLMAVNHFKRGDRIGYGGAWECPEDMPVGVVAIGYGDGYPRHAKSGTPVLVNNQRVPLIGRVSMDMICVDLRSQRRARCGDPVCLWGAALPVEEVARYAGTIPYELLCRITSRVHHHSSEGASSSS
ncbi:MAG: alanine racemase [Gammaproteobacteria bacterium]|jgi:alanine racemase